MSAERNKKERKEGRKKKRERKGRGQKEGGTWDRLSRLEQTLRLAPALAV